MIEITEFDAISEAIVRFVWSGSVKGVQRDITDLYGAEVYEQVYAVHGAALDAPVDWKTCDMDAALGALSDFLTAEFPWLSAPARTRLNYCFIMTWK